MREDGGIFHVTLPLDSMIAERMISDLFGKIREGPLGEAQELVYEAWDSEDRSCRVQLARRALEVSKNCADAYIVLARDAVSSREEAVEFYRKAVEAGAAALAGGKCDERMGDFRDFLETGPYKRSLLGLAECL